MTGCKHEYFKSPNGGLECKVCGKRTKRLFKRSKLVLTTLVAVSLLTLSGVVYVAVIDTPPERERCTAPKGLTEAQVKDGVAYCIAHNSEAELTRTKWKGVRSVWCVKPMADGDKFREMSQCVIEK